MNVIDDDRRTHHVDDERTALIALLEGASDERSWRRITDSVLDCDSAIAVWEQAHPSGLFTDADAERRLAAAREDLRRWDHARYQLHTMFDSTYPQQVRSVRQMPPLLFTEGQLLPHERAVSVVGSRKASAKGLEFARDLAQRLVEEGVTVVGGLAEGIDTAAHQATLDAGGRTVAVLGNGLDKTYPMSNAALQQTIATRGMLLSQFIPDFSPTKWAFPVRNAVMSAYGVATVVVEAGEHSGTRIQAREAVAHGRPVIVSDQVATSTSWGAHMVEQQLPRVFTAATAAAAIEHVNRIMERDSEVTKLVSGDEWP